jgi:phosphate-selective porin OprO/OprP
MSVAPGVLFFAVMFFVMSGGLVGAAPPSVDKLDSSSDDIRRKAREGIREPLTKTHFYWDNGFHIVDAKERFRLKIGGRLLFDVGSIDADDELKETFPDLDGNESDFRTLSVIGSGTISDILEFKLEVDFAIVREIKDNWVRITKVPLLRPFKFGHMKEPFSIERSTSLTNLTFMEIALPTRVFAPGRNIGMRYDRAVLEERMTWAVSGFFNTGSFKDAGEALDRISEANGYDLTGRITGLPWYEEDGRRLLHLGLSYSHGVRDDEDEEDRIRFRTRPETRLTDERLADTGNFFAERIDRINPQLALVSGPLSVQGEYFHLFTDADGGDDPQFWGFYVSGSYFLTGEDRGYSTSSGIFSRVKPRNNFRLRDGKWGAFEVGLRFSYVDLNDEEVKGGKERNFTAGLNWYLTPNARLMFNYIRANVKDRADPKVDDGRTDIVQARFQIAF